MKKITLLFSMLFVMLAGVSRANDAYTINDDQVQAMFSTSTEITSLSVVDMSGLNLNYNVNHDGTMLGGKNAAVAFILAWFLGGLGIHRLYLGTKTMTWVGYILTCGGIFGIVPFVDWILLLIGLINGDISKYEDNTKFFMW